MATTENTTEAKASEQSKPAEAPQQEKKRSIPGRGFIAARSDEDVAEVQMHALRIGATIVVTALTVVENPAIAAGHGVYQGVKMVQDHRRFARIRDRKAAAQQQANADTVVIPTV